MNVFLGVVFFLLVKLPLERKLIDDQAPLDNPLKPPCPRCDSHHTIKNGFTHYVKPKRQCKDCGRQFVLNPSKQIISQEPKKLNVVIRFLPRDKSLYLASN